MLLSEILIYCANPEAPWHKQMVRPRQVLLRGAWGEDKLFQGGRHFDINKYIGAKILDVFAIICNKDEAFEIELARGIF